MCGVAVVGDGLLNVVQKFEQGCAAVWRTTWFPLGGLKHLCEKGNSGGLASCRGGLGCRLCLTSTPLMVAL